MQENILTPLGLSNSTFDQPNSLNNVAHGHLVDGQLVKGNWHIYPELAAAGLWTTANDLAKLVIHINEMYWGNSSVLDPSIIKPCARVNNDIFAGMGVFISKDDNKPIVWHPGQNEGFAAIYVAYPHIKSSYSLTLNNEKAFDLIQEVREIIANAYNLPNFNVRL